MNRRLHQASADSAFDLLVACADWPADDSRNERIRAAFDGMGDGWDDFLALVQRHHLTIFATASLRMAGIDPPERLLTRASNLRQRALLLAGEAVQVCNALEAQGLPALLIKGPLLSQQLYGDPAMRESVDLDVLVNWADFRSARQALTALEYQLISNEPPWDDWRIGPWRHLAKDITLFRPDRTIALELHHRLKSPATLLPGIRLEHATETILMGSKPFPAFPREDLFSYLCVHAATSFWNRLKWLADIRALLAGLSDSEIADLQEHSITLGTGRCTALALLLCHRLWGQSIPQSVLRQPEADLKLADLETASLKRLRSADRRPSSFANTLDRKRLAHLRDDTDYRRSIAAEFIYDNELLEEFRIPRPLRFLYLPLRVGIFVLRKVGLRHNPARTAVARATGPNPV